MKTYTCLAFNDKFIKLLVSRITCRTPLDIYIHIFFHYIGLKKLPVYVTDRIRSVLQLKGHSYSNLVNRKTINFYGYLFRNWIPYDLSFLRRSIPNLLLIKKLGWYFQKSVRYFSLKPRFFFKIVENVFGISHFQKFLTELSGLENSGIVQIVSRNSLKSI